ncbi:MAG: phosphatase PAP2 family protein [Chitinophagaceae bacterium]|nr:phosphatase PAP2 family protein [Chitinophagaceae bacterium]
MHIHPNYNNINIKKAGYLLKGILMRYALCCIMLVSITASAQRTDTLLQKLDSLKLKADTLHNGQQNNINPNAYTENTHINVKTYFVLLASDFKQQLTLPFQGRARDYKQVGELALFTAALSFADKPVSRFAVKLKDNNKPLSSTSNYVTQFGGRYELYTLGALGAYGFIFNNQKMKTTTLLATQSYITAGVIETALKFLTGRQRPGYIDPVTMKNATTFHGPFYQFSKDANGNKRDRASFSSFPSGHTTAAFAAATVYAMEYKDKPIVPIIAYSAATLIGFSRITENKHWPTDVLIGAALGFLSGRQVVRNYHRYAKIKAPTKPKTNRLALSANYQYGHFMPGLRYSFK